jgi:hypothetical protein
MKTNRLLAALAVLALIMMSLAALAGTATVTTTVSPDGIKSVDDALGVVKLITAAFERKDYANGAGLVLAFVIGASRYLGLFDKIKIPDAYDKWVAMGISMLVSVSIGLQRHKSALDILHAALNVGGMAIASWELVLQPARDKFLKGPRRNSTPPAPSPPTATAPVTAPPAAAAGGAK